MFTFNINRENDENAVIYFLGDLDIEVTEMMDEEIFPSLQSFKTIDINLADVPFVDSTGIGLLINLIDTLKKDEVAITISDVAPQVRDIFEIIQLPDILGPDIFK
ncbi:anti-sigma factor antagonist [Bacillus canaveralius]|uniref:Anti-sigma factor antagonist n=1 Tax=Bacillus canaveralius TaxID=1403243 RepID=A0A2N5GN02_9BACI|nr:STAS domain-containing protein [Bacillus canaveralius]PLR83546.1 anti-sigma factor antagonist [Bacillus canaveralius]PLS00732.1 anti-sigma factor antagonist [Bacillus canaveralius]RSK48621.1 anti-sigma factor antagonist [Bacillus canaveralius]